MASAGLQIGQMVSSGSEADDVVGALYNVGRSPLGQYLGATAREQELEDHALESDAPPKLSKNNALAWLKATLRGRSKPTAEASSERPAAQWRERRARSKQTTADGKGGKDPRRRPQPHTGFSCSSSELPPGVQSNGPHGRFGSARRVNEPCGSPGPVAKMSPLPLRPHTFYSSRRSDAGDLGSPRRSLRLSVQRLGALAAATTGSCSCCSMPSSKGSLSTPSSRSPTPPFPLSRSGSRAYPDPPGLEPGTPSSPRLTKQPSLSGVI